MQMTFDEWVEKYKPIENPDTGNIYFETYGKDVEFLNSCKSDCIWTELDNDYGITCIVNGVHYVNRICYCVTEVPFKESEENEGWLEVYTPENLEELDKCHEEEVWRADE